MPLKDLTRSTGRLGTSSVGVSRIGSTTPCVHSRPQWLSVEGSERDTCWHRLRLPISHPETSGCTAVFELVLAAGKRLRVEDTNRLACYLLITSLAERGLPEVLQSLRDMVEFYHTPLPVALPRPVVESVRARVGRSYTAAVPAISEE